MRFVLYILAMLLCFQSGRAQQLHEKPKELETLGRYVGDWNTEVISRQAEWTPYELKYRCKNHAEMILDGWFLQTIEVNHVVGEPNQVAKSVWFTTVDAVSHTPKSLLRWTFQSSGLVVEEAGTWDDDSQTFTFNNLESPPDTMGKSVECFRDAGTIDGSLVFTERIFTGNRRKFFEMVWTRKRPAGIAGKPLTEEWGTIGTPTQPIPSEIKRLEPFVGQWDAEFITRLAANNLIEQTWRGPLVCRWILDGRFVLGEMKVGRIQSKWVIGYDTNKKAYYFYLFSSLGGTVENIGRWNEADESFTWKGVGEPVTSSTRFADDGSMESHIVIKHSGQIHLDMTILATPRK